MDRLKIQKIRNAAGVILPTDLLVYLQVEVDQTLSVTRTPQGIELRAADADLDEQMAVARVMMAGRRRALRELAR
jgi:antitoxin component of MazEF toxin-antitoxin module